MSNINNMVLETIDFGLLDFPIFEDVIISSSNSKVIKYNNKLKQKIKVSDSTIDIDDVEKIINDDVKLLNSRIKNETSIEKILNVAIDIFNSISSKLFVKYGKVGASVFLLLIVFALNSILGSIIMTIGILAGAPIGLAAAAVPVIIAPLVEETAKYISIRGKATKEYFIVFNVFEFMLYISRMLFTGIGVVPMIITRLLPIMLHGTTTIIQSTFNKLFPNDHSKRIVGLSFGIIVHAIWNFTAQIQNNPISKTVSKISNFIKPD